jgi:tripartite-type tricarboxylate transporter receptor subunit TctC
MNMSIKIQPRLVFFLLAAFALSHLNSALAQPYPSKPIRVIAVNAVGSGVDSIVRNLTAVLTKSIGQPIVVENIAGAGGLTGSQTLVRAPADGYTLGAVSSQYTILPHLYENIGFDPLKDITPIALLSGIPMVLVTRPAFAANTAGELAEMAKRDPLRYTISSGGVGSAQHLAAEELQQLGKFKLTHVPYKGGGPAVPDLISGNVDVGFLAVATVSSLVQSGKLKALGVSTARSVDTLAQVPPVGQSIPGFAVEPWLALIAPANLPQSVAEKLKVEVEAAIASESFQTFIKLQGSPVQSMTIDELKRYFAAELSKHAELVKSSGAKLQ